MHGRVAALVISDFWLIIIGTYVIELAALDGIASEVPLAEFSSVFGVSTGVTSYSLQFFHRLGYVHL